MKNNFNYTMPVSWEDIPDKFNWATLDIYKSNAIIRCFENQPYPVVAEDDELLFLPSDKQDLNEFTIKLIDFSRSFDILLLDSTDTDIKYGKAIWERPKKTIKYH